MTLLEHIPAIIKMVMIFFLVLFCIRKKLSLGNAFLLGSLFLSMLFGLKPRAALTSIFASITDIADKGLSQRLCQGADRGGR